MINSPENHWCLHQKKENATVTFSLVCLSSLSINPHVNGWMTWITPEKQSAAVDEGGSVNEDE